MNKQGLENKIKKLMSEWVNLKNEHRIDKIRYSGPKLDVEEYDGVLDALFNDWWSGGKYTIKAEALLAEMSDRNYGLLAGSGSSANLIMMSAAKELYFKDNDKILTLSCGFPTTVNPIIQNRMIPVFVDIDINDLNLSPEVLENALKKDTKIKGVFIANTLGFKSKIKDIIEIGRKYNVQTFFDNCDSYASKYEGRPITAYGKASSYSFYVAHHITMGEGGGVTTNDEELYTIMRGFRNWGRYCESTQCCVRSVNPEAFCSNVKYTKNSVLPKDYLVMHQFEWLGYNLKPLELQSAMLYEQLKKLDAFTEIRKNNYNKLYEYFKNSEHFRTWKIDSDISPFAFPFLISEKAPFSRKHLIDHLTRHKIECRVLFGGNLMKHPAYEKKNQYWESIGDHKNADLILNNFLMLGVSQVLDENHIDKIIESIDLFLKQWK
jgi:CDP-4-dehydro-6-deoxyglucose reductase, E1